MRWHTDPQRDLKWRRWFAWYPVPVQRDGGYTSVWLEVVERKREGNNHDLWWEYRFAPCRCAVCKLARAFGDNKEGGKVES
jgi:hypothetical protein